MKGGRSDIPVRMTALDKIYKSKSKSGKIKRLEKYTWGIGVEHETHIFHTPPDDEKKPQKDFILFDGFSPTIRVLQANESNKIKLSMRDVDILEQIPFEATGRKCNGVFVLQKAPINMPEFISTKPVSSLKTGHRGMESHCKEVLELQNRYFQLLKHDKTVNKQIKKYGPLSTYPFGMSNYVSFPKKSNSTYTFDKDKKGNTKINPEYTGSYHLTMTLPYTDKTSNKVFIEKHRNFANQLQWLEPLLLTSFFSCDDKAVGTSEKRIRGSYRILSVGWGNLAGSDVRKLKDGIGRYSVIDSYWRDGLEYHQKSKLNPCLKPTPPAKREGGISALSSNFRTFDASKEDKNERSGAPMKKPYGMEFRIFDHFKDEFLIELCKIMIYVAENSRVHKSTKYVYKNKAWIDAAQKVMLYGWRAILNDDYIKELRNILGLKIATKSRMALKVFETINKELFNKHKNGDYSYLMLEQKYKKPPFLPNINRRSWEHGFMVKLNREKTELEKFNNFISLLPKGNKKINIGIVTALYKHAFKTDGWMKNLDDVLYFMEGIKYVKLSLSGDKIVHITTISKNMVKIDNMNLYIHSSWNINTLYGKDMSKNYIGIANSKCFNLID
jgi:hypothetical protein